MSGPLEQIKYSKAGRPTWAAGSKFRLLSSEAGAWQRARDAGKIAVGLFYTNMAKKFIAKYGWVWDDVEKDGPDPGPDEWEAAMDTTGLNEAQVEQRAAYFKDLRLKINLWYLHHYGQVANTEDQKMEVQKLISQMVVEPPTHPRRKQLIQLYSALHYKKKGIKEIVDELWPEESKKPTPLGQKKVRRLDFSNKVTSEYFDRETSDFKKRLEVHRDELYDREMEEYQAKLDSLDKAPVTAEDYHTSLGNSAAFLQPLADLCAQRFGAAVSILLVTPIGAANGAIEMRSVHAGVSKTLNAQIWPQFDELGFDAVQTSFVNFGRQVFTKKDQESRILPNLSSGSEDVWALPNLTNLPDLPPLKTADTPLLDITALRELTALPNLTTPSGLPSPPLAHTESTAHTQTTPHTQTQTPPHTQTQTTPHTQTQTTPHIQTQITPHTQPTPAIALDGELTRMLMADDLQTGVLGTDFSADDLQTGMLDTDFGADGFFANLAYLSSNVGTPSPAMDTDPSSLLFPAPDGAGYHVPSILPPDMYGNHATPDFPARTPATTLPAVPPSEQVQSVHQSPPHRLSPPPAQSASGSPTLLLLATEDVPLQTKANYAVLLECAHSWGNEWTGCINEFIAFERSRGFNNKAYQLPKSDLRPAVFKKWNALHRPSSGPDWEDLGTGDGAAFGHAWWVWWVDMQPPGRRGEAGSFALARRDVGVLKWNRLGKSGPHGMFLVLVGMVWWKRMVGVEDDDWCKAVVDVSWALRELTGVLPLGSDTRKRKRKDTTNDEAAPLIQKQIAPVSSYLRTERKMSKRAQGIAL